MVTEQVGWWRRVTAGTQRVGGRLWGPSTRGPGGALCPGEAMRGRGGGVHTVSSAQGPTLDTTDPVGLKSGHATELQEGLVCVRVRVCVCVCLCVSVCVREREREKPSNFDSVSCTRNNFTSKKCNYFKSMKFTIPTWKHKNTSSLFCWVVYFCLLIQTRGSQPQRPMESLMGKNCAHRCPLFDVSCRKPQS